MGLDTVEIAMEVEESFDITIPDGRAAEMRTVGDLYSFILEETRDPAYNSSSCLTAAVFYELRQRLDSYIEDARSLRPRSDVDTTIPRNTRRVIWSNLSKEMDLRFPSLCRPLWIASLASVVVAVLSFVAFFTYAKLTGPGVTALLTLVTFALASWLIIVLTSSQAVLPTQSFRTYRGLVTQLVAMNYAKLSTRYGSWSPTDVWNVLQVIIAEQLGVKKEEVTRDASFRDDLGCD